VASAPLFGHGSWSSRGPADAGLDLAFVSAVDMPYLTVELIDELIGPAVAARCGRGAAMGTAVTTTSPGSTATGLADRADALVAAGERSMRALVDVADTQRVVMSEQRALTNVNTVADLV